MTDNDILREVSDSLAGLHMRRPVEPILARGRAVRRGRVSGLAAASGAAAVALAVGVTAIISSGHAPRPASQGTAQLAAFTVVSGPNGTSTLTLRKGKQYRLDPAALRQALAQHGIPALVTVDTMCGTAQQPAGIDKVMATYRRANGTVVTTFNPGAMPAGAKLSIGYFPTGTSFALIKDGAPLTCGGNPGGGPGVHRQITGSGPGTFPPPSGPAQG